MLSSWGSALRSSSTSSHVGESPPEVERHGSLLLSLSVDGTLNVSSVEEGSVLVTHQHANFGEVGSTSGLEVLPGWKYFKYSSNSKYSCKYFRK